MAIVNLCIALNAAEIIRNIKDFNASYPIRENISLSKRIPPFDIFQVKRGLARLPLDAYKIT